jgi:hypothetical protein
MTMKTNSKAQAGVKVTTAIKAGGLNIWNHSRGLSGLSVKSGVKAGEGIYAANHSRRLSSSKIQAGVKVTTTIKAGGLNIWNHSRGLSGLSVKSGVKTGEGIYAANHSRRLS